MRFAFLFLGLVLSAIPGRSDAVPPELAVALEGFRTEGSFGWGFVQTTQSADKALVERYDPAQPEVLRWTLVSKDGQPPTEKEVKTYREQQTRRTRGETAPNVKNQLDRETCSLISDDGVRAAWRFRLKPGASDDRSAAHMAATFTLHRPTGTIERVELASFEPFSPMFSVNIEEAKTILEYTLPEDERPTLLKRVSMRVRGRAMWFKSLDSDLSVMYSDYVYAGKK